MTGDDPKKTKRRHGTRSSGRELALKFLYAADLTGQSSEDDFDQFVMKEKDRGVVVDFARHLILGVIGNRDAIDARIQATVSNWKLERIAVVDRNILRLGIHELDLGETPPLAVINEAVELAKKFGSRESGAFVNGILDRVRTKEAI